LLIGCLQGATKEELLAPCYSPSPGYWDQNPMVLCSALNTEFSSLLSTNQLQIQEHTYIVW